MGEPAGHVFSQVDGMGRKYEEQSVESFAGQPQTYLVLS